MANFYAFYPPAGGAANASVGPNGTTAPTSSTEIGGINPSGNLTPVSVDNSGNQNVNVVSSALPAGGATSANQVLEIDQLTDANTTLTAINGDTAAINTAVTALNARVAGALVPAAYDEIDLLYYTTGNGNGQLATATYLLGGSSVATLLLLYDVNGNLSSVTKS